MAKQLTDYNFFDPETLECPFGMYKLMRQEAPVYQVPGSNTFIITRHSDIRVMLKDTETFSSDFAHMLSGPAECEEARVILKDMKQPANTLLTLDPPRHRVYRTLVNKVFSAKRVEQMHDYIQEIVDDLISSFIDKGECEFISAFCSPLPLLVIADQLGIPRDNLAKFKEWSDALAARLGGLSTDAEQVSNARSIMEFQQYIMSVVEDRRVNPRDDMISDLSIAEIDEGRRLSDEELLSLVQQFLVAGNETTAASIAGGLLSLIQNPDQMQTLRGDCENITNAVEEILRMETPSAGLWRVVKKDTEFKGVKIPKDSMVMLRYHAANRDEEVFDDAEGMDVCRDNANDHIAFGQGTHFCPGAMLGRKEMNLAFRSILSRMNNIQLAEGKNDLLHWPNMVLRGLKELHITFDKQ